MSDVPEKTATGFSIATSPLPSITVNNKTNPVRRLFTLYHELAHIALRQGGLCDLTSIEGPKQPVEVFCNRAAGAALVPHEMLRSHPLVKASTDKRRWGPTELRDLAADFRVSKYVVLIRLHDCKFVSNAFAQLRLSEYREQEATEYSMAHFALVHDVVASTNGRLFARLVLDSYFNEQISLREVSDLLDLNLAYLDRLADRIYREAS